jgi:glutathione S-transferase
VQAHERRERAEWQRSLGVINTIIGIMGGDPITMDGLQQKARGPTDRDAYEAWKGRNMGWISSHLARA